MLLALPVLAIPAAFLGPPLAHDLQLGLEFSLVVGGLLVGLGYAMLKWDRFARGASCLVGRLVALVRRKTHAERVANRLVEERDQVADALDKRWIRALTSAAASRMADYAVLVASLVAVGAQVRPSLVLVAYVAAMALGMIPITPGGVGIVEAGLTGLLVLAGRSVGPGRRRHAAVPAGVVLVPDPGGAGWPGWSPGCAGRARWPEDILQPTKEERVPDSPNILIIWGDDIGQSNLSCYSDGLMGYRTPNIDRIADEGVRFTDYYGEQSCTAGRAAFITGQNPYRTGLTKVGLPGRGPRPARRGPDDRDGPQGARLRDRTVRQEPLRGPRRVPAHDARLRRVLRQPVPPERRGGARAATTTRRRRSSRTSARTSARAA